MPKQEGERVHVPTGGREDTILIIIDNPNLARKVQRDIVRRNLTPDTGSKGRRNQPQKNTNR
jgi:hypothetical protein